MEVYRSGHNEPDSKSGCHLFVAREFESLRLRLNTKKAPQKGAFFIINILTSFFPYIESLFYSPDVHRSYILPLRISIPKASLQYI